MFDCSGPSEVPSLAVVDSGVAHGDCVLFGFNAFGYDGRAACLSEVESERTSVRSI